MGLQIPLSRDRHLDDPLGEPNVVGYLLCKWEPWETTYPTQTFVHLLYWWAEVIRYLWKNKWITILVRHLLPLGVIGNTFRFERKVVLVQTQEGQLSKWGWKIIRVRPIRNVMQETLGPATYSLTWSCDLETPAAAGSESTDSSSIAGSFNGRTKASEAFYSSSNLDLATWFFTIAGI